MLDKYKWINEVGSCLVLLCTLSSSHTGLSSALVPKLILTFSPFSSSSFSWKVPRVITGWTPACYSGFHSNITSSVRPSLTTPSNTTLPACRSYSLSCYSDLIFLLCLSLTLSCLHGEFLSFSLKWMFSEYLTLPALFITTSPHFRTVPGP